jgi:peptide/nickel transport system substrate-binding protein
MRGFGRATWISVAVSAVVALAVAGCGSSSSSSSSSKGLTIALGAEPTTLDPLLKVDGSERWVTDSVYDTLMGRSVDGQKLVPKLAAAPPKLVNATTWRFKLRPGIKFQDGEPLNADAVVYSVKRITNPKYNSEQLEFVNTIKEAKKVDDLTVDIITKGSDPILPSRMYWMRVVAPKATQANANKPVGTGPYRFVQWVKGDHITLKANPNYWGSPKPTIQTITYKFVPEQGAALSGLVSGEYDLITNLLPDEARRAPVFKATLGNEHPMLIVNARPGAGVTDDVRVRQALNYAVDKNAIAKNLFGGFATVDNGQTLSPTWFGYDPSLKPYPYDPAKAKQLIQQAGATGKNITIVGESGRWLNDKDTIQAVAQYWRAAGLKVTTRIVDFNSYLEKLFDTKDRPQVIFVSTDNPLYDADRTLSAYYAPSGQGASNSDKEIERLTSLARNQTNLNRRRDLYHQVVDRAYQQAYLVWLVNTKNMWGMSKRLDWQPRQDAFIFANTMKLK